MRVASFWGQSQNWRAHMASANARYYRSHSSNPYTEKLITAGSSAAASFANTATDYYYTAATLAARAGKQVQSKMAAESAGAKLPAGQINSQVSFTGTLSNAVDFGADGPSVAGGFQFVNGTALKSAFSTAMLFVFSQREAIDTVTVSGNTLTASTSGDKAHDVFTLKLSPVSGTFVFTLLNPIDLFTTEIDPSLTLNLSALMQGVKSTGETVALPNTVTITIDEHRDFASGKETEGTVHQGELASTAPTPAAPESPAKYKPPINPLTGRGYAATSSGLQSIGVTLNLFY